MRTISQVKTERKGSPTDPSTSRTHCFEERNLKIPWYQGMVDVKGHRLGDWLLVCLMDFVSELMLKVYPWV